MSTPNIPPLFERTYNHLKETIEKEDLSEATKTQYLKALDSIRQEVISSPNSELAQKLMGGIKGRSVQAESRLAKRFMEEMESQSGLSGKEVEQRHRDLIKKTVALASSVGVTPPEPKGPFKTHELKEIDAAKLRNAFTSFMVNLAEQQGLELRSDFKSYLHSAFNNAMRDLAAKVAAGTCSLNEAADALLSNLLMEAIKPVVYECDRETFHILCQEGNALYENITGKKPTFAMEKMDGEYHLVSFSDLDNSATGKSGEPWPEKKLRTIIVFPMYENEGVLLESICVNLKPDKNFTRTLLDYFAAVEQDSPKPLEMASPSKAEISFESLAEKAAVHADQLRNAFTSLMVNQAEEQGIELTNVFKSAMHSAFNNAMHDLAAKVAAGTCSLKEAADTLLSNLLMEATKTATYETEGVLCSNICNRLFEDRKFKATLFNYFTTFEQDAPKTASTSREPIKFGKAHVQDIELVGERSQSGMTAVTFDFLAQKESVNAEELRSAFNYILRKSNLFDRRYTIIQLKYAFDKAIDIVTVNVANKKYAPAIAISKFLEHLKKEAEAAIEYKVTREEFRTMCQEGNELHAPMTGQQVATVKVGNGKKFKKVHITDLYDSTTETPGILKPWLEGETKTILVFSLSNAEGRALDQLCHGLEDSMGFVQSMLRYFNAVEEEAGKNP